MIHAIASNEPFSWTKTFTDPRLCAIADRLTFAGQIIETGSISHRRGSRPYHQAAESFRRGP
jgi:hypothetical protein